MVREAQGDRVRTDPRTALARCDLSGFAAHTLPPPSLVGREVIFRGGAPGMVRAMRAVVAFNDAWVQTALPYAFSNYAGAWDRALVRQWLNRESDGIWTFSVVDHLIALRFSDPTACAAARIRWG